MNYRPINWPSILGRENREVAPGPSVPALSNLVQANADRQERERAAPPVRPRLRRESRPAPASAHPHKGSVLDVTVGPGGEPA